MRLGSSAHSACAQPLRLVEVLYHGKGHGYLTKVLTPDRLSLAMVVALYWRRWRIEEAFWVVKRLLGLAYLRVGSENGIQLPVWAICLG